MTTAYELTMCNENGHFNIDYTDNTMTLILVGTIRQQNSYKAIT